MIHYSAYWHCWSRVLSNSHPTGPNVEINLTPIGLGVNSPNGWIQVKNVWVRKHGTALDKKDRLLTLKEFIDEEAYLVMGENLGFFKARSLLLDNYLYRIDWDLFDKHNNGGAPFEKIRQL